MVFTTFCLNTQGLLQEATTIGQTSKRCLIFKRLRQTDGDVFLLQETHCPDRNKAEWWRKQWGGKALFAIAPSRYSKGSAILIHPSTPGTLTLVHENPDSSWIWGRLSDSKGSLNLLSVHAPNHAPEREAWILELKRVLEAHNDNNPFVIGGDWNCVPDTDLDSANPYPGLASGGTAIEHLMHSMGLIDSFREVHPLRRTYTRWDKGSANRLDRIYVPLEWAELILPLLPTPTLSDHHLIGVIKDPPSKRIPRPCLITSPKVYNQEPFIRRLTRSMETLRPEPPLEDPEGWLDWFDEWVVALVQGYRQVADRLKRRRGYARVNLAKRVERMEASLHDPHGPQSMRDQLLTLAKLRKELQAKEWSAAQHSSQRMRVK
jgi:exonuclease III